MRVRSFGILWVAALLVFLSSSAAFGQTTPAFGPKQYTRLPGPPQTFTETFPHCGTAACQIVVVNGSLDGTSRISSATISLNGVPIVRPGDFSQQTARIVRPVVLADQNELTVTLASKPGSFLTVEIECAASGVVLSAGAPGVSVSNQTLLFALPVINTGTAAAQNVRVAEITLTGGTLASPVLPLDLGTIAANGSVVLNADFSGIFAPLGTYPLEVRGTYSVGSSTYCFELTTSLSIPPAAPGSSPLGTTTAPSNQVTGAPFPHRPPDFDDEVNMPRWTVPTGPFVPGGTPPGSTSVLPAPFGDPPAIVFEANQGLGLTSSGVGCSGDPSAACAEPSGGVTSGGFVFATSNWSAAYSTNGTSFTTLDPTKIFPDDEVGFCCDQVVQYVPSIDRVIWLLQGKTTGGYRVASASPAQIISSGGTSWTYWKLTPQVFGEPAGTSFDYPDLSVGSNALYMSWDGNGGFQVARTSLAGLQAGGTITIEFTHPSDAPMAWGSHLTQNTVDEIFWAGHNDSSSMRVFSLKEGSNTYFWRDVGISSWANNSPTSTTPDGQDWLAKNFNGPGGNSFPKNGVIGATRSGNQVWFGWSAGTDDRFSRPHVEMVSLDRNDDFSKIQQVQIWNDNYAFAYPALATNGCTGEIGLSFEFGGNGNYENHVVGFWGDFVAYITTGSTAGTDRYGDYVTIHQAPPTSANPGNLFSAFGFGVGSVPPPGTGLTTDVHYVLFGRPASSCNVIR